MVAKAVAGDADLVFLDLEDSIAPGAKNEARQAAIRALRDLDWGSKTRAVRINGIETEFAYRDIIEIVEAAADALDVLIVPKVKSPVDVLWVDRLLGQIESRLRLTRRIGLEVLIEEVEAMIAVEAIAASTPRLEAIIFGMGDFSASQGIKAKAIGLERAYPGDIWHYHRNRVVIAARAAGIDAIDGPYGDFRNVERYREECLRATILGCVGKWAIHPAQIPAATEIFSPPPAEIERARRMAATYAEAERQGVGSIQFEGVMVDAASVRIANNTVIIGDLIDRRRPPARTT